MNEGMSRWDTYQKIAVDFGLSVSTVYTWLAPEQIDKQRRRARLYGAAHRAERMGYLRSRRQRADVRVAHRIYMREYMMVRYHLQDSVEAVLADCSSDATLTELRRKLEERTGFGLREKTLLRHLERYESNQAGVYRSR